MRGEDAQGTPTQSHVSPSILAYEDNIRRRYPYGGLRGRGAVSYERGTPEGLSGVVGKWLPIPGEGSLPVAGGRLPG